jgi:hypothetical protein
MQYVYPLWLFVSIQAVFLTFFQVWSIIGQPKNNFWESGPIYWLFLWLLVLIFMYSHAKQTFNSLSFLKSHGKKKFAFNAFIVLCVCFYFCYAFFEDDISNKLSILSVKDYKDTTLMMSAMSSDLGGVTTPVVKGIKKLYTLLMIPSVIFVVIMRGREAYKS